MSEVIAERQPSLPNKVSRILLLGVKHVIGENRFRTILTMARLTRLIDHLPQPNYEAGLEHHEVRQLFEALEAIYGSREGCRLAREIGNEFFKQWIRGFGNVVSIAETALYVLPPTLRTRIALEILAEFLDRHFDQRVILDETESSYLFVLDGCGFCPSDQADSSACAFVAGFLEATLSWISRGYHSVIAAAVHMNNGEPTCVLSIRRSPSD